MVCASDAIPGRSMTSSVPKSDNVPVKLSPCPPDVEALSRSTFRSKHRWLRIRSGGAPGLSLVPAAIVADPSVAAHSQLGLGLEEVGTNAFDVVAGGSSTIVPPLPSLAKLKFAESVGPVEVQFVGVGSIRHGQNAVGIAVFDGVGIDVGQIDLI